MRVSSFVFVGAAAVLAFSPVPPATAQSLTDGDFEQCSVHDREGKFKGYDSVCLERKRLALARLRERQSRFEPALPVRRSSALCPYNANLGAGFLTTWWQNGQVPPFAVAYDAPVNGRPCIPNQIYIRRGQP
jgi:hypothetical protein